MKRSLLPGVLALAALIFAVAPAQGEGGFGWTFGLRLTGDASWWCDPGRGGNGPQVWPAYGPNGGYPGWGNGYNGYSPYGYPGGYGGYGGPVYGTPVPTGSELPKPKDTPKDTPNPGGKPPK